MCSCHSILECCVMFSGVKLSIGSFVLVYVPSHGTLMSQYLQKYKQFFTYLIWKYLN